MAHRGILIIDPTERKPEELASSESSWDTHPTSTDGDEFDALILNASRDSRDSPDSKHENDVVLSHLSEEAIADVVAYLTERPELASPKLIAAIGELITLDAANEASVRSRAELEQLFRSEPQKYLFLHAFIDRIGIITGRRWVVDKDIHQAVAEAKIEEYRLDARGAWGRAWDGFWNRQTRNGISLSDELESLFATKIALEREIRELDITRAAMFEEQNSLRHQLESEAAQQRLQIVREHQSMIAEQIKHQQKVADNIGVAQEKLERIRNQHIQTLQLHRDEIGRLHAQILELKSEKCTKQIELGIAQATSDESINEIGPIARAFWGAILVVPHSGRMFHDFESACRIRVIQTLDMWRNRLERLDMSFGEKAAIHFADIGISLLCREEKVDAGITNNFSPLSILLTQLVTERQTIATFADQFKEILQDFNQGLVKGDDVFDRCLRLYSLECNSVEPIEADLKKPISPSL